ncbi:MAG: DNA-3-methyladenine glycosylase I, partial [Pseudomonadota bacterium]|nr:DNA-3-methyladenine glycosylase I [Pseudomonadota bacterium]
MRHFDEIYGIAATRHGGEAALEALLPRPKPQTELCAIPEDRWLSTFTRAIFQAGFNWSVIEAKWDGFETAFNGFDIDSCAMMDDETFDALLRNKAIVRNAAKIAAVRDNATFLLGLRAQGGASQVFATWPVNDFIGLMDMLKTRGNRLGGTTGAYALRSMGCDSFILSRDVTARLVAEGVIDKPASSKTALRAVQAAF